MLIVFVAREKPLRRKLAQIESANDACADSIKKSKKMTFCIYVFSAPFVILEKYHHPLIKGRI